MLLLVLLLTGCTKTTVTPDNKEMPEDFNFIFVVDFVEVNTTDSTIKNTYYFDEGESNAITNYSFTDSQMEEIYQALITYNIQELPEELEATIQVIPPSYLSFTYTLDGVTNTIVGSGGAFDFDENLADNYHSFTNFMHVIWSYVTETEAYQSIPDGPYLE